MSSTVFAIRAVTVLSALDSGCIALAVFFGTLTFFTVTACISFFLYGDISLI